MNFLVDIVLQSAKTGNFDQLNEVLVSLDNTALRISVINQGDETGRTAVWWACWNGYQIILQSLVMCGADVNKAPNNGFTALMVSTMKGDIELFQQLIENGANLLALEEQGADATYFAVQEDHLDILLYIIEINKCVVNRKTKNGRTPISIAWKRKFEDMQLSFKEGSKFRCRRQFWSYAINTCRVYCKVWCFQMDI